jgi:hypothetical protein
MATVTPNFNWPVPTSTDLVKDGATAIEALGDSIDASLVDLKGGTTGQVLSKASNTDMDFTWVTDAAGDITGVTAGTGISGGGTSGTVTVTNSMATAIDAKGDLVPGTGADTFSRLAVGANGTVLTADSAEATGLKWATPASSGALTLISSTTLSSSTSTITFSSIPSTYTHLQIVFQVIGTDNFMRMTFNNVTTSTYYSQLLTARGTAVSANEDLGATSMRCGTNNPLSSGVISIPNYKNTAIKKTINVVCGDQAGTSANQTRVQTFFGTNAATTAISQIDITCASVFDVGSIFSLYGVS